MPVATRRRAAFIVPVNPGRQSAKFSLSSGGAEVFGYAAEFEKELKRLGQVSPEQFAAMYRPPADYVPQLTWDPTTAQFWDAFNTGPAVFNANQPPGSTKKRLYDFRLNPEELDVAFSVLGNDQVVPELPGRPGGDGLRLPTVATRAGFAR